MTQIVVSAGKVIYAALDSSFVELTTGVVSNVDGSHAVIGQLANGSIVGATKHSGVTPPDADPSALPYLDWNGSALVEGADYAHWKAQGAQEALVGVAPNQTRAALTSQLAKAAAAGNQSVVNKLLARISRLS